MRFSLIAVGVFTVGAWRVAAQVTNPPWEPTQACLEFNRSVASQITDGRLADAEAVLSRVLTDTEKLRDDPCGWLSLQNAANIAHLQGRWLAAEGLAGRSFRIVDRLFPANDPRRLPSLQVLWSVQSQLGKPAEARRKFEAMLQLRLDNPRDRAIVHGAAGVQLQLAGKFAESEVEFRAALLDGEEAGIGGSADQASVLCSLGLLYFDQNRLGEAELTMDRALILMKSAPDAVPFDYIRVIQARAALHVRQKQWTAAAEDLSSVIALAEGARLEPAQMKARLATHVHALRKAHRRAEARAIESRAAAIHDVLAAKALVDVSELRTEVRTRRR